MKPRIKRTIFALCVILVTAVIAGGWYLSNTLPMGTGHVAKTICSNVFISKRNPETVFREDIAPVHFLFAITKFDVNKTEKSVASTSYGFFETKAIFREGCGCTVLKGTAEEELRRQTFMNVPPEPSNEERKTDLLWPTGDRVPRVPLPDGVDGHKLNQALAAAFSEPAPDNPRKTRAVIVVYDGKLVAERYAPGFSKTTPLLGWSMSKSVTNALVGIQVKNRWLDIKAPAPVAEWQNEGNPRREITLDQLLRMSAGLEFEESYLPPDDTTRMLFESYDFAAYAANKPLEADPGAKWNYSSGTANIVARIVRQTVEKEYEYYYQFLYEKLFDKIGMYSAVMEPDASGTFVGSSYTFATPRDWARFGLLYLQDGVWQGERILPEGWVKYSTTPTPQAPRGEYGALFWLNSGSPKDPGDRRWPSAPRDAFAALGFQEQKVIIIPSKKLVLVRFGATSDRKAWNSDEFIANVLAALPN